MKANEHLLLREKPHSHSGEDGAPRAPGQRQVFGQRIIRCFAFISSVPDFGPTGCHRLFPCRALAARSTAAIAPRPTAVRKEGFGSHFIAPKTISGGLFACGAEWETDWCPFLEIGASCANRSRHPWTNGIRS